MVYLDSWLQSYDSTWYFWNVDLVFWSKVNCSLVPQTAPVLDVAWLHRVVIMVTSLPCVLYRWLILIFFDIVDTSRQEVLEFFLSFSQTLELLLFFLSCCSLRSSFLVLKVAFCVLSWFTVLSLHIMSYTILSSIYVSYLGLMIMWYLDNILV